MPEVRFQVRWPDGSMRSCYSPSTVIRDHLFVGQSLPVGDFVARARTALEAASSRVEARYGRPCSIALREIAEIERAANDQAPNGAVTVESMG